MSALLNFGIIGITTGAPIGLMGMGIVACYRGSRVVNFAQAAIALVGAYVFLELDVNLHLGLAFAIVGGVLTSIAVSLAEQFLILSRMQRASQLTKIVATVGVLIVIEQATSLIVSPSGSYVPEFLPTTKVDVLGDRVSVDLLLTLLIVLAVAALVFVLYQLTQFGRITTASMDNSRALNALGHSGSLVASLNWAVGGCLTGIGAILLAPMIGVSVESFSLLLLGILAAGVIGQFKSFGWVLVGALLISVLQSELSYFLNSSSWTEATPFVVIVVLLAIRGTGKLPRTGSEERLPTVGRGVLRLRYIVVIGIVVIGSLEFVHGQLWLGAVTLTAGGVIVLVSIMLVTGLAGQVSLAQFTFAGIGAWITSTLIAGAHVPVLLAAVVGTIAVLPVGIIVGTIALRTRGVNLAIITISFAAAVEYLLFNSVSLTGPEGINIGTLRVFGLNLSFVEYPYRYAAVAVLCAIGACVVVANVRRSSAGRALLAQRVNERGAESLGVNVTIARVFAFSLASIIAAVGGEIIGLSAPYVLFGGFTTTSSLDGVAQSVVGGMGFIFGAIVGALAQPGAILYQALTAVAGSGGVGYIPLALGVVVIFVVLTQPDGIVAVVSETFVSMKARVMGSMGGKRTAGLAKGGVGKDGIDDIESGKVDFYDTQTLSISRNGNIPSVLRVEDLVVRFGSITAVDHLSLEVVPGHIVGLIGPNGAGKTTVVDAITGFTRHQGGKVRLGERDVSGMSPHRLAGCGLTRSFQSLELFEDLTVRDNLAVACEAHGMSQYVIGAVKPQAVELSPVVAAAVESFELRRFLDKFPRDLSYGDRRLVAVARAVATAPSILFLDEPAAGLDSIHRERIAGLFKVLSKSWGIGVVLVEHDLSMVFSVCDHIYLMDVGRIVAGGTPAALRSDPIVKNVLVGLKE